MIGEYNSQNSDKKVNAEKIFLCSKKKYLTKTLKKKNKI
jgi:hypothetical protein